MIEYSLFKRGLEAQTALVEICYPLTAELEYFWGTLVIATYSRQIYVIICLIM